MTHTTKHKGWFYLCPVFIYDVESECLNIKERHWSLMLWLMLNFAIAEFVNLVVMLFGYEPGVMLSIGDKVEELTKAE